MPWKNGGGTTLELAVDPPGATLETGFRWRLSSADVAASGPFSAFPGLERWLLLLAGAGFHIDFGPHGRAELTEPFLPIHFSGDWPAVATLAGGPSQDFNLMVDPRRCRARLETLRLEASLALPLQAATTLLFVARGTVSVPAWNLHLGHRHLLRVERGRGALSVAPGLAGAVLVRMDLDPA
ncbi:HutD family protein [Geothrix edaphica]|uniref:HutD family protein n=1 Tax=Geothrix edaphica TaxID=2927976 RepID=A0ABQ5PV84_9BACT|nr:HutD family protein [Geothrix edaphica]GLH66208.1 hypothetical protein GETHED_05720 [Geothrix edaphica]